MDVRDLGGHLDFTRRARAGTLSKRVKEASHEVAAVRALPLCFSICQLGCTLLRHRMLLPPLLALSGLAIVRAVWSNKMHLANAPVILGLLDGPGGVDPGFYIVWARFRMMRRYLAYFPEEEPHIFHMLDLISRGAEEHVEIGFAWEGEEREWLWAALPPLRMMTGLVLFSMPGISVSLHSWLRGRVFGVLNWLILSALYNYLTLPT